MAEMENTSGTKSIKNEYTYDGNANHHRKGLNVGENENPDDSENKKKHYTSGQN